MTDHALEDVLRELRPTPRPTWAADLDRRAARSFAKPPGSGWFSIVWKPAFATAACVGLIAVVALNTHTGSDEKSASHITASLPNAATADPCPTCESSGLTGGESATAAQDAVSPQRSSAKKSAPAASAGSSPAASAPALSGAQAFQRVRKVERTVSLTLAAKAHDIDTVADGVVGVADRLGGYVASSSVSSQHGGEFVLKVPAAQLQAALAQLSRLAHVRARTQDAQDITGSYDSARARLADARTERKSLLRQLAKATTPNETESIRARLRLVSGQISAGKDEVARVNRRAALATLNVSLVAARGSAAIPAGDGHWTPRDALHDAGRILEWAAGALLVALAIAAPLGLLAVLGVMGGRVARRRQQARVLDSV